MDALQRTLPDTFGKRLRGVEKISAGQRFAIGDIDVHAFAISTRRRRPHRIYVQSHGAKFALVTDLGYLPELVKCISAMRIA